MAAIKTTFVLLLIAFAMVMVTVESVRVPPCDQVCSHHYDRDAERNEYKYVETCLSLTQQIHVTLRTFLNNYARNKMAAIKTTFVLLLIAFAMVMVTVEAVRVAPCDQVCNRIDAEKNECCRAHGYSGYSSCRYGQMQCH
ncbi:hypothetical protein PYW08_004256 [Mythimna loreyi]|uniref:Uncharacterized protein n=1 Tax=Mythimna loreyi TaxID=667449 RepID=A0ACC2QPG5_9NEOP|nr:hypothetical protein PYW08_004256 [Mythimna loreyi]